MGEEKKNNISPEVYGYSPKFIITTSIDLVDQIIIYIPSRG
jgi:hypothetical protein